MLSFAPAVCADPPFSCLLPSLTLGMEGRRLEEEPVPCGCFAGLLHIPALW